MPGSLCLDVSQRSGVAGKRVAPDSQVVRLRESPVPDYSHQHPDSLGEVWAMSRQRPSKVEGTRTRQVPQGGRASVSGVVGRTTVTGMTLEALRERILRGAYAEVNSSARTRLRKASV